MTEKSDDREVSTAEYLELLEQMTPEQQTVQFLMVMTILRDDDDRACRGENELFEGLTA